MHKLQLSEYHKIFYNEWKLDQFSNKHNIYIDQIVSKKLNLNQLSLAFSRFITDHALLNSHIAEIDEIPYWVTNDNVRQLEVFDDIVTSQKITQYISTSFMLDSETLYRFAAFKTPEGCYRLILVFHNIILQESAVSEVIKTLSNYYNDKNYKTKTTIKQQKNLLANIIKKEYSQVFSDTHKQFWHNILDDTEAPDLRFIQLTPRTKNQQKALQVRLEFPKSAIAKLTKLKPQFNIDAYGYGTIILSILLHRYTSQEKFGISHIFEINQKDNSLFFGGEINNVIYPYSFDINTTALDLITKYIEFTNQIHDNQHIYYPITNIVEDSNSRILPEIFCNQSNFSETCFSFNGTEVIKINNEFSLDEPVKLAFSYDTTQDKLNYVFTYNKNILDKNILKQFVRHYKKLYLDILLDLSQDKVIPVNQYQFLNTQEYNQIVHDWNNTRVNYPLDKTIHGLFEEQVNKTPDNIAIVYEDKQLTYKELNQKANQLAHYLKNTYEIKGDELIALCLNKSEYMLIAILGVLKAGGAYVPLDPAYPKDRINYILQDTQAKILITTNSVSSLIRHLKDEPPSGHTLIENENSCSNTLIIDNSEFKRSLANQLKYNPKPNISSSNLAYVIYTSGTTGKPKGVMIEHASVINYISNVKVSALIAPEDTVDFSTSIGFDLTVTTTICALSIGAKIALYYGELQNIELYKKHLINNQVNVIKLVPSYFELLVESLPHTKIKKIILGGEKLDTSIINKLKNTFKVNTGLTPTIYDEYGPTEATVGACINKVKEDFGAHIGKPYANYTTYILGNNLTVLPVGAIGELYIGGSGLARGYLNLPQLTAERFIPNPFQTEAEKIKNENSRLYKTGDLVRYLPDSNIEYIGRNDFQVKIRGYRIELGEIEVKICNIEGIKQAVVLALEHQNSTQDSSKIKHLVGYYVADKKLDENQILEQLNQDLPEYMVPSILVHLDKLPLTINGKLDQKALPNPEFTSSETHVIPRNELEQQVCNIYAEVLGIDAAKIGIKDNFFRLGGNSILAIKLVSQLNRRVLQDNKINVTEIFKHQTIGNLLESRLSQDDAEIIKIPKLGPEYAKIAPLSFAQERLWFIETYEGGSNAYNIPMLYKLDQAVNLSHLENAIKASIARHEVLHSQIRIDEVGSGYQEICDLNDKPLIINQIEAKGKNEYTQIVNHEVNNIFKLDIEYPIKINILYRQDSDERYLLLVVHHIAFDGWSMDIFLQDIKSYYNYYIKQNIFKTNSAFLNLNLPELTIQYKDFAVWQRTYLIGDRLEHQLNYWRNKLAGYTGLNLITDYTRPKQISYIGNDVLFSVDNVTTSKLRQLAKDLGVSLYSVLLSGFNLLLRVYSNQDDIVIGTPIANRHHEQLEHLVGFFVNTLALRSIIKPQQSITDYIKQTGLEIIEAQLHQDLPFEKLVAELNVEKDLSRHPIFQVMFGVQTFGRQHGENKLFIETNHTELNYKIARFDLTLMIDDSRDELECVFNYATSLYMESTIKRFVATYIHILGQLPTKVNNHQIIELSYLSKFEYNQVVYDWNATDKVYPKDKTIHELFEEQVEKTPDNIAIVYEDTQLTYKELNARANQVAHHLRDKYQIKGDDLIALCLDRSEHMLIAVMATLKAGGGYVPIDPEFPERRIKYILEDTNAKALLTNKIYQSKLQILFLDEISDLSSKILSIDSLKLLRELKCYPTTNLELNIVSTNLAYVIYTSGTTGNPKGVMIEHRNVINYLFGFTQETSTAINVDFSSNLTFDLSVTTTLYPLVKGYKICVYSGKLMEVNKYVEHLNNNNIQFIKSTPSFLSSLPVERILVKIKECVVGGEKLDLNTANIILKFAENIRDEYGPTEATVGTTKLEISKKPGNLSIGKPYTNYKTYILEKTLTPSPIGAIGELYIGGEGVARGYLNLPELTKERFIPNPFQSVTEKSENRNARLYKTGDLVRYLATGSIEYIGRNDFQVKIRGFRIELGEIETRLVSYPGIKQAVVLAREHQSRTQDNSEMKYLAGYYVADEELDENQILTQLRHDLPEYMVPTILVHLDNLPLTINGKLDRKALPNPEFKSGETYVAPSNELEQEVCNIYAETLGIDVARVGMKDNFFSLGGNSILAIKLVSQLNRRVLQDNKINVTAIFKHQTIANLLDSRLSESDAEVNLIPKLGPEYAKKSPLSFAQERLWFIEIYEGGSDAYNTPMLYKLEKFVDVNRLSLAIEASIDRHEALRTFLKIDETGSGYQEVFDINEYPFLINWVGVIDHKEYRRIIDSEVRYVFKLDREYPIRASVLTRKDNGNTYLLMVIHHVAIDGWAVDVFLRDVQEYYKYYEMVDLDKKNNTHLARLNLPHLSIQYKDFAVWQRQHLNGARLEDQLKYWKNKLSGYEHINLPTDYPRPKKFNYSGDDIVFYVDKETSQALRNLAQSLGISLYGVMLAAFNLLLKTYSNQNDIIIGIPIANRHHEQLENVVGFFVNTLILRSIIDSQQVLKDYIVECGREIIDAQSHQDLPFEKLVDLIGIEKDDSRHPIFQVMFSVQSFGRQKGGLFIETEWAELNCKIAKFDLMLMFDDSQDELKGEFNYATSLYNEATIRKFIATYIQILDQIKLINIKTSSTQIKDLSTITPNQQQQLIKNSVSAKTPNNNLKNIILTFEEFAIKQPYKLAVIDRKKSYTYAELRNLSNQIANCLLDLRVKPADIIAVSIDNSVNLFALILGIMKVGAIYVPLSSELPVERINKILHHCKPLYFIIDDEQINFYDHSATNILKLSEFKLKYDNYSDKLSEIKLIHNSFIIYTSGSTGTPKAILQTHTTLKDGIDGLHQEVNILPDDIVLQHTPISFDISLQEIFYPLSVGASLCVVPNSSRKDLFYLMDLIEKEKVSVVNFVPSMLQAMLSLEGFSEKTKSIYIMLVGGEALSLDLVKLSFNKMHDIKLYNVYGPSETFYVTAKLLQPTDPLISIGSPIGHAEFWILDNDKFPLPIGTIGELYIGGSGLASGYLHDDKLTAEKFISTRIFGKSKKLYKTGDLVRWLPNGELEYITRTDFQLKIRGNRIEATEVELTLSEKCGLKSPLVIKKEKNGTEYLAAYYLRSEHEISSKAVEQILLAMLPAYAVPSIFVPLDSYPLSVNGKVDRKLLPEPEFMSEEYVAPRNDLELQICNVYAEVLELDSAKISMKDDFFRLGGNSILAIKLVSLLNNRVLQDKKISVAAIFKHKTIGNLVDSLLSKGNTEVIIIPKLGPEYAKTVPLSFAQERLWFIETYEGGSNAYNIPALYQLVKTVNIEQLISAIKSTVERHEVLHSLIKTDVGGNGQLEICDLTSTPLKVNTVKVSSKEEYKQIINNEVNHIFSLDSEYPIRVNLLFCQYIDEIYLLINIHHIAFDGWSLDVLLRDIQNYYDYYAEPDTFSKDKKTTRLSLPELSIQYKDFAVWQKTYLTGTVLEQQLEYWKNKLSNYEIINLPTDYPRPKRFSYVGNDIVFHIDKNLSQTLRGLAQDLHVSLYSVMLSGFYLLLKSYSNQNDLIVGSPIANRHFEQLENLVGFFVNTLALRSIIDPEQSIENYVKQTGLEIVNAQLHQDLPFEKLVDELNIEKDISRHPIFQVLFSVQTFGRQQAENKLFIDTDYAELNYTVAKFDLSLMIDDSQDELEGIFEYATTLYTESTIKSFIETYLQILRQLGNKRKIRIKELEYLSESDFNKIIYSWNDTTVNYPNNKTLQGLFEEQVAKTPNNIAIVYEDAQLTYNDLNEKANQLGHYLKNTYNIKGDDLIALCLDRTQYTLIVILAILKAGGAYVPLDPSSPVERISYILEDTQAKVLITHSRYSAIIQNQPHRHGGSHAHARGQNERHNVLVIDHPESKLAVEKQPRSNLTSNAETSNLAYVIYTSGTTGKPKGVMIEHKGIVSLVVNNIYINITADDTFIQLADMAFDAATFELWGALLNGSKLYFPGDKLALISNLGEFDKVIHTNKISVLWLTKTLFNQIYLQDKQIFNSLNYLLVGGEALDKHIIDELVNSEYAPRHFINGYGPTEHTTFSCTFKVTPNNSKKYLNSVPIGKPIANTKVYIVNQQLTPVPIGAIGELCVCGAGISRGYLNLSELTKERFIANPFQTEEEKVHNENSRLYKTGDLVRYLPDGNIEYMGRNDFQVKIRGFRIELGEIESKLSTYPGVKQAVVLVLEHQSSTPNSSEMKYLAGYYVADNKLDENQILKQLGGELPEYMVPSVLVYLDKLPLTINGKLDRKALPDPEFNSGETYVAPRNDLEQQVCKVYGEVLGIDAAKIGMRDNFFRLGGNSILAIKLINRLNNQVFQDNKINVAAIFKYKTIDNLLDSRLSQDDAEVIIIPKLGPEYAKKAPLSFAQERLWFIESYEGGSNAYNIPMLYKIPQSTEIDTLNTAINSTIARHEILHSLVKTDAEGNGYLEVGDLPLMPLVINTIKAISNKEYRQVINTEVNHVFRLDIEYPIRVNILHLQDSDEKYLLFVVHHISFDGWSIEVFLQDIKNYYNYYIEKNISKLDNEAMNLHLPELTIQYKDFAVWQRTYLSGDRLEHQLNYWRNKLAGYTGLTLITDYPRPKQISYIGDDVLFSVDVKTTAILKQLAKDLQVSLYSVLLSGFNLLLRIYSSQDSIVIGTPIANRHHAQLEHLIGFFVNTLALRSNINPEQKVADYIKQTGQEIIEAQLHQDLPFEKLVEELNLEKDESRHPVFQVMFGVQTFGRKKTDDNTILIETSDKELNYKIAKFDITLIIDDSSDELEGMFNYATRLYHKSTIKRFIATYIHILKQLATKKDNQIIELSYLSKSEYIKIIYNWNDTKANYPTNKTLHGLFEEQVAKTPDYIAVVYEDIRLTYDQLNKKANQLGHYLRDTYNIKGDDLIALCLDRNEYTLVAMLGVLKAGGAYVPIDPHYPQERINYILKDTQAKVQLCNSYYKNVYSGAAKNICANIILIDDVKFTAKLEKKSTINPITNITSDNLAYIIYTSGTTGKPKGVMIQHNGVVNLITAQCQKLGLSQSGKLKNCLFYANYVFDAHVMEVYNALLTGNQLHIASNEARENLDLLNEYINANNIKIALITPALLSTDNILQLETLIVGGDVVNEKILSLYINHNINVINAYGPTEITVCATMNRYVNRDIAHNIGKPLANISCYILDTNLTPLPVGAVGELYIGGVGLARGYLNLPELTTERFIDNPFQTQTEKSKHENNKLYKTGDLARYLADGNIEYITRNDDQVKIRGHRIELREIEAILSSYPEVKQATVLPLTRSTNDQDIKYLVGYYVADKKLDEKAILTQLKLELPEYMVPNILVYLSKLPLNINGKLDKKSLPNPEFGNNLNNYVMPSNDIEIELCNLFGSILGLDTNKIGIFDNFFALGGNSISAIKLTTQLNTKYTLRLKVADIFVAKCVKDIAGLIEKTGYKNIVKLNHAAENKPLMFMIHSANAGCEVYVSLAKLLEESYQCYGIDNYNLYNKEKFKTLNSLANYYLGILPDISPNQQVIFLGWSMGGLIALEMASILERLGFNRIKVYLMDTIIVDETMQEFSQDTEDNKAEHIRYAVSMYGQSYAEKVANNYENEISINNETISNKLQHTSIILYKAMQPFIIKHAQKSEIGNSHAISYILDLKYNNIDRAVESTQQIKVIKVPKAHHGNILDFIDNAQFKI